MWRVAQVCLVSMLVTQGLRAEDWPNWRGPRHDGKSGETGLNLDWPTAPPPVWQRTIGPAFSSFACVDGRLFTCGTQDGQQTLLCLNADNGEVLWQKPFEAEYVERQGGDGTRATPTVSDGRVYVVGARGRVLCVNAADGAEVWTLQLSGPPQWGFSGSVLIEGETAVLCGGGTNGALIAVNKASGAPVWKGGDEPVGYSTPYPFTHEGQRYIAGFMGTGALIVQADTGAVALRMPWKTDWQVNASTPIYHDGHILFSSGYNHGAILLQLQKANGALKYKTRWEGRSLRNKFQSSILHEGFLYTSDETGLKCVEFLKGDIKWQSPRAKHGTIAFSEGRLLILSEKGELTIAPAQPAGYEPRSKSQILEGRCWTVPVISNGRLYARDDTRVVCIDLRRPAVATDSPAAD